MAAQLGIGDRIGFTGFLADPATAMRALDIVVHASTQPEPFGLAIVESMACNRAVVASNAGGAAEIIALGNGVIGHAPGDVASLAKCMERLVLDPALRARMGQEGRDIAERFFDRARLASELIPIYREAAEGRAFAGERMRARCGA
jgi:glycosyltransferase involved in cell wall biosynthesis